MPIRFCRAAITVVLMGLQVGCLAQEVEGGAGGGVGGGGDVPEAESESSPWLPAPITGGTLLLVDDDRLAVVSDADRERLWFFDLQTSSLAGSLQLEKGSRPSRATVDGKGLVHVVLRGTGKVAHIDPRTRTLLSSDDVCPEPRGIDFDRLTARLLIACQGGELDSLSSSGERVVTQLQRDLRDVVIRDSGPVVTTFRSASVTTSGTTAFPPTTFFGTGGDSVKPAVAWRTVAAPGNRVAMVHQRMLAANIVLVPPTASGNGGSGGSGTSGYGSGSNSSGSGGGSAGGSGGAARGGCDTSVVGSALTIFGGGVAIGSIQLPGALPVDLAVSPTQAIAVAFAADGQVAVFDAPTERSTDCAKTAALGLPRGQFVGVAWTADGRLVAHSRSPSFLSILPSTVNGGAARTIHYASDSVDTAGSRLFHTEPVGGARLACASCHPEGGEDGFTWKLNGELRRTQPLNGGISDRAPYHWKGDQRDLRAVMTDTFVARMGGTMPTTWDVESLQHWLDSVPAPKSSRSATAQGRKAFEKASCSGCHSGERLTNNVSVSVGPTATFKVPSLIGLQARAPYMHNGCATTILDRFTSSCGGERHGDVALLSSQELADLVTYLESL